MAVLKEANKIEGIQAYCKSIGLEPINLKNTK